MYILFSFDRMNHPLHCHWWTPQSWVLPWRQCRCRGQRRAARTWSGCQCGSRPPGSSCSTNSLKTSLKCLASPVLLLYHDRSAGVTTACTLVHKLYLFLCAQCHQYRRYTHSALAVSDTKELVPWLTRGSRHLIENVLTLGFPQDGCRQLLYINSGCWRWRLLLYSFMYLEHIWFQRVRLWRWGRTDVWHGAVCGGDKAPACRHGGRAVETVCRRGQAHRGVDAEKNSFK